MLEKKWWVIRVILKIRIFEIQHWLFCEFLLLYKRSQLENVSSYLPEMISSNNWLNKFGDQKTSPPQFTHTLTIYFYVKVKSVYSASLILIMDITDSKYLKVKSG